MISRKSISFAVVMMFSAMAAFSQQNLPSQDDSTTSPLLQQHVREHAAEQRDAAGKAAPERDDPRARLEWEVMAHGVPSVQFKQQLHALRMEKIAAARAQMSRSARSVLGAAAAVPGVPAWIPIGPTDADTEQNGPSTLFLADSGRARTILPDPKNADHLYFLTSGGGLWVTSDFTSATPTWTPLSDSLPTTGGGSVSFGRTPTTLYLGTGDPFDVINVGGSMVKSIDGGANWSTPIDLGAAMSVRDVKIDLSDPLQEIVLVATDVGLFRSADSGTTYVQVLPAVGTSLSTWSIVRTSAGWLTNAQPCTRVPADACATTSTIYVSSDAGATWVPEVNTTGIGFTAAGRTTLAVGAPGDSVVYAFSERADTTDQKDLFRSIDGGLTWTALGINNLVATNAAGNLDQPNVDLMHGQAFYNQMVLVDPRDANRNTVYIGGDLSSAKTVDGGVTWSLSSNWLSQFGLPYVHADMHAAAITAGPNPLIVFGTDGGLSVSADNGVTFSGTRNAGLQTQLVYTLASTPSNPSGVIAGMQDVGTRSRVGNSTVYNQIIGGDGMGTAWSQANSNVAMGTVEGDLLFPNFSNSVSDLEESWDRFQLPVAANEQLFFTAIATPSAAADPTGKVFFSYSALHVFRTVNGGVTWTSIGAVGVNVPFSIVFRAVPHGISVSPVDLLHIAVAGAAGHVGITADGGTTWSDTSISGFVPGFANVSSIAWADNSTLYITSENPVVSNARLVKSTDGGATWARSDTGLPDVQTNRVVVDPRDATHNTLYVASELGVFRSIDAGATWSAYGTGLPNVRVNDIYMSPDGSFLRIATYGRGIWELPSLTFSRASLVDDGTSCDRDGVLDNGETGHLNIVLHNDGGSTLSGITATVSSTNPAVTFPGGTTVTFPAAAAGADTTGSLAVALNGASGIQQLDFKIAFTDPALNLPTPVTAVASLRANYDEVPASSTSDDFEALTSPWTVTTSPAESLPDIISWHLRQFAPLDRRWVGVDSNAATDTALVSPVLLLGGAPLSFTFSQRYLFENDPTGLGTFFDGGVIELSTDGGATWADVSALGATISPAYPHTLSNAAGSGNILAGRAAFSGISPSYPDMQTVQVNLPASLANSANVKIRFRIGTDFNGGASGWTIDNFAFTGLANTPFPSVIADRGACLAGATTTTVSSNLNPSTLGSPVIFTATVSGATTPTGTVTFNDGAASLGTGVLSSGQATVTTSALAIGSHSITASYGGDNTHSSSVSPILTQVVNAVATTTSLISNPNPSTVGQSVTFTITVAGGITPTGSVTINDGVTPLGTAALNTSGLALFSTAALAPGTHSITAIYAGDAAHAGSTSAALSQGVNGITTSTALASIPNPSVFTQSVTFTASVTGGATPTGNLTFNDGATPFGTSALNASGVTTFTTSALTVGTHTITAVYAGDATHNGSSSPSIGQVVNISPTSTTLSFSVNPSTFGQAVVLQAAVAPTGATGTVTFTEGAATIGSGALSAGNATFSISSLAPGTHTITASYSGDANFSASASTPQTLTVNQAASATSLAALTPATFGTSVTFHATVAPPAATGTVTFKDGASALGTSPVIAGAASFATASLAPGSHSITAVYSGDAGFTGSTSAAQTQTVTQIVTTTTVVSSLNPAPLLAPVTLTATVSSSAGIPAGSVTFNDGAAALGTSAANASGVATLTVSSLTAGAHSITAAYGGSTNFAVSTSAALVQTISAPDYKLASDKSSATILAGQSATFTITTQSVSGFAGTVNFSCNNLPTIATCAFTPASVSVTGGGTAVTSTLVVKTTGPHAALLNPFPNLHPTRTLYATLASLMPFGVGIVLMAGGGSFKRRRIALMLLLGLLLIVGIAGCGGSSTPPPPVVPSTPAGTTAFTVSTTSTTNAGSPSPANPNQQLNISITVQP